MSKYLKIEPKTRVLHEGRPYVITNILDLESVLARDPSTGRCEKLLIKDLKEGSGDQDAMKDLGREDLLFASDEDLEVAERRLRAIRPLLNLENRTLRDVKEAAREADVHHVTLYQWIRSYEQTERISSLLPRERSDKGRGRLKAETEVIVRTTIEEFYLTKQRRSVTTTCSEVLRRCRNAKVTPPHPNTVRNRILQLSEETKLRARRGRREANHEHSPLRGHFPGADWPLSVVQIDHTKVDIVLVDEESRLPIGRPWVTLAIDVYSRMIPGIYISLDPPGTMSTALCIARSILPKEEWLALREIDATWPCWGKMKTIHVDNAGEFRGEALKFGCQEHGISIEWRPLARPNYGGHIERLLGTLLTRIHELPGTTFSNPRERGRYDSDDKSALTLKEFERWLMVLILKEYHLRRHTSLDMSPLQMYEKGMLGGDDRPGRGILPPRPTNADRLLLDFMPLVRRTVQDYGILLHGVHYYSDVLRRWVNARESGKERTRKQFIVKWDPRDISAVYFLDPELKEYFRIPYRNTSRPAMSIWELRRAKEQAIKKGWDPGVENDIFRAREELRSLEEAATKTTRAARRRSEQDRQRPKELAARTEVPAELPSRSSPEERKQIVPFDDLENG